jgi:hypothetical protein
MIFKICDRTPHIIVINPDSITPVKVIILPLAVIAIFLVFEFQWFTAFHTSGSNDIGKLIPAGRTYLISLRNYDATADRTPYRIDDIKDCLKQNDLHFYDKDLLE